MCRLLKISLAFAAICGLAAAPAGASVKFGSSMLGPVDSSSCIAPMGGTFSCTFALSVLPPANQEPGGITAPSDGVIVAWTVRSGNSLVEHNLRLRVIRGNEGVATGPLVSLPLNGGFNNYAARISVKAGDKLGLDTPNVPALQSVPVFRNLTGAGFEFWAPPLADGDERAADVNDTNRELLLNATLEPDADSDGWGDETQDACPGKTDASNACPASGGAGGGGGGGGNPIPTEPVPDTKIVKAKYDGAKATFRFRSTVQGAKFSCKLDKKPWKSCKSPKVYNGLKEGRHSFKVKAIGPTAVPDPTPAKRTFRVEL